MHRQVDSILCVHDISLIGLRSISHAQKIFISSYRTLLWNNFRSWRKSSGSSRKTVHHLSRAKAARYLILTLCFPVCRNAEAYDIRCWHEGGTIGRQCGQVVRGAVGLKKWIMTVVLTEGWQVHGLWLCLMLKWRGGKSTDRKSLQHRCRTN